MRVQRYEIFFIPANLSDIILLDKQDAHITSSVLSMCLKQCLKRLKRLSVLASFLKNTQTQRDK